MLLHARNGAAVGVCPQEEGEGAQAWEPRGKLQGHGAWGCFPVCSCCYHEKYEYF